MDSVSLHLRQQPQFEEGRREAQAAIEQGRLEYRLNGKLDWETCEQAALQLRDGFEVSLILNGQSLVENMSFDEGFNERMAEEFLRRFDRDVISEVFREVERRRRKHR
jgi:hypothetical protein